MEAIEQVPKTALDVFRLLPEGTLCEVIDNVLYMSPAPKYSHQKLVLFLAKRISNYTDSANSGELIIAPLDVYLEEFLSAVQPDLFFISNENSRILREDGCVHGVPDLIVEVLSSDKNRDLVQKKNLYERAGVKEYFIVNPANRNVIAYSLKNEVYQLVYQADGHFKSAILDFEFYF